MKFKIQNYLLKLNEFTDFLGGIYFLVAIASIIFSIYMLKSIFFNKDFKEKRKLEKIFFIPAAIISLIFIINLTLCGDITPKLTAEEMARRFAYKLCDGSEFIYNYDNKIFTQEYQKKFYDNWEKKLRGTKVFDYNPDGPEFEMIEYHYERKKFAGFEKCEVILETSKCVEVSGEPLLAIFRDIYFHIQLTKIPTQSKYLGNYMRWRISGFDYSKSKPYALKEKIKENIEKMKIWTQEYWKKQK